VKHLGSRLQGDPDALAGLSVDLRGHARVRQAHVRDPHPEAPGLHLASGDLLVEVDDDADERPVIADPHVRRGELGRRAGECGKREQPDRCQYGDPAHAH
jgi:hypothetical protein